MHTIAKYQDPAETQSQTLEMEPGNKKEQIERSSTEEVNRAAMLTAATDFVKLVVKSKK